MNKIYKVIFNHRLGNFVVVSELAKSCGKTQSVASEQPVSRFNPFSFLLKTLTAGILLALGTVQTVMAAESVVLPAGTNVTLVANKDGTYSIKTNANISLKQSISGERNPNASPDSLYKLNGFGILKNSTSVGLGNNVTVGKAYSIAIGENAVAESIGSSGLENREGSIAIGGNAQATKRSSIALGWNTRSNYSGGIAIGGGYYGDNGSSAKAGWDSTSLGFNVRTEGARNTVAIGSKLRAEGEGNIVLSSTSDPKPKNVLDEYATVKGKSNIVIGADAFLKGQHNPYRKYEYDTAKYRGSDYQVWDDISNNVVIGAKNTVNGGGSADFTTRNAVFGSNNIINAGVKDSVVIGSDVTVAASNTVYIGSHSEANLEAGESTAGELGMTAFTDTEFTTIFGTTKFAGSGATGRGVVTVGSQGKERLIQYVAPG